MYSFANKTINLVPKLASGNALNYFQLDRMRSSGIYSTDHHMLDILPPLVQLEGRELLLRERPLNHYHCKVVKVHALEDLSYCHNWLTIRDVQLMDLRSLAWEVTFAVRTVFLRV